MPKTVENLFTHSGLDIHVEQSTYPGVSLASHYTTVFSKEGSRYPQLGELPQTVEKINQQQWDAVVLQEPTASLLIPEEEKLIFEAAAMMLDSLIKIKNGKTILYQNYTTSTYPAQFCHPTYAIQHVAEDVNPHVQRITKDTCCSAFFSNSLQQFDTIRVAVSNFAAKIKADVAPIGAAFEMCKNEYPEIDLYSPGNHPSPLGSYLIACVFYKTFTGRTVTGIDFFAGLEKKQAKRLQKIADRVAYNK